MLECNGNIKKVLDSSKKKKRRKSEKKKEIPLGISLTNLNKSVSHPKNGDC